MHSEINLYENSRYLGFYSPDYVYAFFEYYEKRAGSIADQMYTDEIVLYAVYDYYPDNQNVYSADFMILKMPYADYFQIAESMLQTSRLFFMRGRKDKNEN